MWFEKPREPTSPFFITFASPHIVLIASEAHVKHSDAMTPGRTNRSNKVIIHANIFVSKRVCILQNHGNELMIQTEKRETGDHD
jgi:hypothetical protein